MKEVKEGEGRKGGSGGRGRTVTQSSPFAENAQGMQRRGKNTEGTSEGREKKMTKGVESQKLKVERPRLIGHGGNGRRGCHDPSTTRPDAPQFGAEEKIGPLRSG